jgi:hypothetical protein
MTPVEWLGATPDNKILVHEVGHIITGLSLGIQENEIEFLKPGQGEMARAHYSRRNLAGDLELPRVLGGMYSQARLCPSTVDDALRKSITELSLFADPASVEDTTIMMTVMEKHGFQGDWWDFFSVLKIGFKVKKRHRAAITAHARIAAVFEENHFADLIPRCTQELLEWLNTPDENLPYSIGLFYHIAPIRRLFDAGT